MVFRKNRNRLLVGSAPELMTAVLNIPEAKSIT
jgi:hypothetical protein